MNIGKWQVIESSEVEELRKTLASALQENMKLKREVASMQQNHEESAAQNEFHTLLRTAYIMFMRSLPAIQWAEERYRKRDPNEYT